MLPLLPLRLVPLFVIAVICGATPSAALADQVRFDFNGGEQTWTVPPGVSTVRVEASAVEVGKAVTLVVSVAAPRWCRNPERLPGPGVLRRGWRQWRGLRDGGFNGGGARDRVRCRRRGCNRPAHDLTHGEAFISLASRLLIAAGGGGGGGGGAAGGDAGVEGGRCGRFSSSTWWRRRRPGRQFRRRNWRLGGGGELIVGEGGDSGVLARAATATETSQVAAGAGAGGSTVEERAVPEGAAALVSMQGAVAGEAARVLCRPVAPLRSRAQVRNRV